MSDTPRTDTMRERLERALWKEMNGGSDDMWENGISPRGKAAKRNAMRKRNKLKEGGK